MAAEPVESEPAIPRTKLGAETYERVASAMRKARGDEIEVECRYSEDERQRLLTTAQVLAEMIEAQTVGVATRAVAVAEELLARAAPPHREALETFAAHVGGVVRALEARVAALEANPIEYAGTFQVGRAYERRQFVTSDGSLWFCRANTTVRPGAGEAAWQLAVKKGRDAR
jgi:hypothetical protein